MTLMRIQFPQPNPLHPRFRIGTKYILIIMTGLDKGNIQNKDPKSLLTI